MRLHELMSLEAGKKLQGRLNYQGLKISIEHKKGSIRSGTSPKGKKWETKMSAHYGYILTTKGADGEHVDCYVGPNMQASKVYVVHQVNPATGKHDEDKCILGCDSSKEAKVLYLSHMDKKYMGSMSSLSIDKFKKRVLGKVTKRITADATMIPGGVPIAVGMPGQPEPPNNLVAWERELEMTPKTRYQAPTAEKQGKSRVPTDDPGETDDKYLDVTRRDSKETKRQRKQILDKSMKRTAVQVTNPYQQPDESTTPITTRNTPPLWR